MHDDNGFNRVIVCSHLPTLLPLFHIFVAIYSLKSFVAALTSAESNYLTDRTGDSMPSKSLPSNRPKLSAKQFAENFHGFLEVAPDAVVVIDQRGEIVQFNFQAERLFGYERVEILDRSIELLMPSRFRSGHIIHRMAYNNDMRPRLMGSGLSLFGAHKNGSEFPIDVMLSPLNTKAGIFIACAIHDMTTRKHLENELRRQAKELEDADRQKDEFLAMIMHELRGPLSALGHVSDLLGMPEIDAAGRQKAMLVLKRQTAHMIRLVNDLLDVSKVRGGELKLKTEIFDLRSVIAKAVEISQAFVVGGKHALTVVQSVEPLMVKGDPVRLTQVVSNIVTNAAKYTPCSGNIVLTTERQQATAIICVQDDGDGIPVHMLNRVFELFTQVERVSNTKVEGMGIGLALVQRLVHLHDGEVEAASAGAGLGSTFTVRLPLVLDPLNAKALVPPMSG